MHRTERPRHDRLWYPPPRSERTGHRAESTELGNILEPIPTRDFPLWWWPFEIVNRVQARLVKYLPVEQQVGSRVKLELKLAVNSMYGK